MSDTLTPEIAANAPWIGSIQSTQNAAPWYWITGNYYFHTYEYEVWRADRGLLHGSSEYIKDRLCGIRNAADVIAAFKAWCEDNDFEFKPRDEAAPPPRCPECKGSGKVTLFFSVEACSMGCPCG